MAAKPGPLAEPGKGHAEELTKEAIPRGDLPPSVDRVPPTGESKRRSIPPLKRKGPEEEIEEIEPKT